MKKIFAFLLCSIAFWLLGTWSAYSHPFVVAQQKTTPAISVRSLIFPDTNQKLCYSPNKTTIRILMYHYIREDNWDPAWSVIANNSISPALFEEHVQYMHWLTQNNETTIIFMSELEKYMNSWCFPNDDITILTFDDGRWDNYGLMFPIAKKYWIKTVLWLIDNKVRHIERVDPFMNLQEAREMLSSRIVEFQSHSYSHPDLTTLWYTNLYKEICTSKENLESLFWININTFIYPMGKNNLVSHQLLEQCGYTFWLSTRHGDLSVSEINADPWRIQRIRISKGTDLREVFK